MGGSRCNRAFCYPEGVIDWEGVESLDCKFSSRIREVIPHDVGVSPNLTEDGG